MSSLIKISQLLLVISQQTLGFEQTLGKNHFGHITFDQDMPVINKWITCHPDCSSKNNISLEMNNEIKPFLEILDSRGNTYENYLVSSHGEGHELEVHYRSRNSSNEISQIIFRSDIENRFLETIIQSNNEVILKFDLLSDEKKEVIKKYGVWGKKSFLGKEFMGIVRTTFLINSKGKIHKIWSNVRVKDHAKEVFEEIKNI